MKIVPVVALLLAGIVLPGRAHAGIYTDDLSRCLVDKTTRENRVTFVRWMFAATAAHPAVASISKVTAEMMEQSNKEVGDMFMNLMTVSCRDQAQKALRYEGPVAIQMSFQTLGQVAAGELFTSPEVKGAMAGMEKYVDKKALEDLSK